MKAALVVGQRHWLILAWACSAALAMSAACGSDDGTKKAPRGSGTAGAGGASDGGSPVNMAGDGATPVAGSGGGSPSSGDAGSGTQTTPSGGEGGGSTAGAGGSGEVVAGAAGASGAAGAGGAGCDALDPTALVGVWTTNCNGYTCKMNVAASGKIATGCTNGQYATGTLNDDGTSSTLGEGGPYAAFSTAGAFSALDCSSLKYDYKARIPPNTGTEVSYSCTLTRVSLCQPTLREALAGTWETTCGGSTCSTTFTVNGAMTSTCSNGQHSSGTIDETGAFSDTGSGGNFPDYSTVGVIAPTGCDSFLMPYTYQTPPNQGTKHAAQCSYVRKAE